MVFLTNKRMQDCFVPRNDERDKPGSTVALK